MKKSRLAIFVFYDSDGIADDFVKYYLENLKAYTSRIVIVCNGAIGDEARTYFEGFTTDVILRENTGYDVMAWKTGLEYIGWDELEKYDELILANDTVFGPIYPFGEMFDAMSCREELDFWGVTSYGDDNDNDEYAEYNPFGYIPSHIQSYFIAYNKRLISSDDFNGYWTEMPEIQSRAEAIGRHEAYQTKYFEDLGYEWDVYARLKPKDAILSNDLYYLPDVLLKECRLPFIKRNAFILDLLPTSDGVNIGEALEIVRFDTNYDDRLIWQNISRCYHQYDVARCLGHYYIVPAEYCAEDHKQEYERGDVVLFMHLYYPDMFPAACEHAKMMPENTDIYITTNDSQKAQEIRAVFSLLDPRVTVRIVPNRGRSESALLVGLKDVVSKYKIACFWKEKKSDHLYPYTAEAWSSRIEENLFCSKNYVNNILLLFERNPYLGMLSPAPAYHADLFSIFGNEWNENFENTKILAERLDLNVPMSEEKPPIAPFGGAFWFRTQAMGKLFEYDWQYACFPQEPIAKNATILHAIERVYPYVCQDAGYYPAYVLSDFYARNEIAALSFFVRENNKIIFDRNYLFAGPLDEVEFFKRELGERDAALRDLGETKWLLERWQKRPLYEYLKRLAKKVLRKK